MARKRKRRNDANATPSVAFPSTPATVQVDGSLHEGGGQMVRTALGLSAALNLSVQVSKVRAGRSNPGLNAQHVAGAYLCAALQTGTLYGAHRRSQTVRYDPPLSRVAPTGDTQVYEAAVGTAGATALVLQAALPALISRDGSVKARLHGGTHVTNAPTAEYVVHVLVPTLARFGVTLRYDVVRKGFYPRGGGLVDVQVKTDELKVWRQAKRGRVVEVRGYVVAASEEAVVAAERMREAVCKAFDKGFEEAEGCDVSVVPVDKEAAPGMSVSVTVVAVTDDGAVLGASRTLDARAAKEAGFNQVGEAVGSIGEDVVGELMADLETGAVVDRRMADQVGVVMALIEGECCVSAPDVSLHMKSVREVLARFHVSLEFEDVEGGSVNIVCKGRKIHEAGGD